MLTGTYTYSTDSKGRVVLPAQFRQHLGAVVVLARAPEGCVLVLTAETWQRVAGGRGAGAFGEYWLAGAHVCDVEPSTGRVLIPADLRVHLGLRAFDELTVAGVGEGALLCRRERFSARLQQLERRILAVLTGAAPELVAAA